MHLSLLKIQLSKLKLIVFNYISLNLNKSVFHKNAFKILLIKMGVLFKNGSKSQINNMDTFYILNYKVIYFLA